MVRHWAFPAILSHSCSTVILVLHCPIPIPLSTIHSHSSVLFLFHTVSFPFHHFIHVPRILFQLINHSCSIVFPFLFHSIPIPPPPPPPPPHTHSGVHHKKSCNEAAEAAVVRERLRAQKQNLFPETLHLDSGINPAAPRKAIKNFGGWGDIRDHELCLSFVNT